MRAAKMRSSISSWTCVRCSEESRKMRNQTGGEAPSTETYLFSYLRMLDTRGEGFRRNSVRRCRRAVAHYGITSLDRSPNWKSVCYGSTSRISGWSSRQRQFAECCSAAVAHRRSTATGRTRLSNHAGPHDFDHPRAVSLLSAIWHTSSAMVASNSPASIGRACKPTLKRKIISTTWRRIRKLLDRYQMVRALVECPQPLATVLSGRFATASPTCGS